MKTEVLKLDGSERDSGKLQHASRLLQAGQLVAFPTETVYGLGANARDARAVARLRAVKGRADGKPFSLLVPSLREAEAEAGGLTRMARKLARIYWPGPLTLVVPKRGGSAVGLRLSEHPIVHALLARCGFPLAAPSANRSGHREPRNAQQVLEDLDGKIALLLDGRSAWQGRPSSVVLLERQAPPVTRREGAISGTEILERAHPAVLFVCTGNTCRSPMAERMCRAALQGRRERCGLPFRVRSAGTNVCEGQAADPLAQRVMEEIRSGLSAHRARQLHPGLLDAADWIFTMTRAHRESILKGMPECRDRIRLLSARGEEIPDPVARPIVRYRQVRDRIAQCLREVVRTVTQAAS